VTGPASSARLARVRGPCPRRHHRAVAGPNQNLELTLARWVLGELPPEDVPMVATEALVQGCSAMTVAVLAGLQRPTSADVEAELPALLEELRVSLPERREALKIHVDAVARDVVLGVVTPSVGTSQISRLRRRT
jgi:hypothetical protein